MINVLYVKVRNLWRFHGVFSSNELLTREMKHLDDIKEKYVVKMFPELDMKAIEDYANTLNQ